jgi:hypothetical protein
VIIFFAPIDALPRILRAKTTILSLSVENLRDVDLPVSEAAFDGSFTSMLTKRFLDRRELRIDV